MRSEMDKFLCYLMIVTGIATTAMLYFGSTKPPAFFGLSLTMFGYCALLTAWNRDRIQAELSNVSEKKPLYFSLRLKGYGIHDGIWIGKMYFDPVTGQHIFPTDREERLLSRVRLSAWIGGMSDETFRAPRYTLDKKQMKLYIRGADYRFDVAAPDFDYALN